MYKAFVAGAFLIILFGILALTSGCGEGVDAFFAQSATANQRAEQARAAADQAQAQAQIARIEVDRLHEQNMAELRLLQQQQAAQDAQTTRMAVTMLVLALVIVGTVVVLMRGFAVFVATSDTHTEKQIEIREREMQLYLQRAQVLDVTRIGVVEGQPARLQQQRSLKSGQKREIATRSE